MGVSCHFVLVALNDPVEIAGRLGGRLGDTPLPDWTETRPSAPGPSVGPWWNGWLFVADPGRQLAQERALRVLSRGTALLRLDVEEHVMAAEAASWRDGREEWAIVGRDGDPGPPATRGAVPPELPVGVGPDPADSPFGITVAAIERMSGWSYDGLNPGLGDERYLPILGLRLQRA